jgi:hypothetical protein
MIKVLISLMHHPGTHPLPPSLLKERGNQFVFFVVSSPLSWEERGSRGEILCFVEDAHPAFAEVLRCY